MISISKAKLIAFGEACARIDKSPKEIMKDLNIKEVKNENAVDIYNRMIKLCNFWIRDWKDDYPDGLPAFKDMKSYCKRKKKELEE
jgi:hypothetical protein